MATIEFRCPGCEQVCAFQDRHVGRRARCTKCNGLFLIPADGQPARLLKTTIVEDGPWSGFWTALLLGTPKALLHPNSLLGIALMIAGSVLRFYLGHPMTIVILMVVLIPIGIIVTILTTGFQCRYLFDVIQSTTDQNDSLPPIIAGSVADRIFQSISSTYVLLLLVAISLLPAGLVWLILTRFGAKIEWPIFVAGSVGLFFLPLSMTIYAYSRDFILCFRLDYVLRAACKAFGAHLVLYGLVLTIAALLWQTPFYLRNAPATTAGSGAVIHAVATGLCILMGRTAGLFYRHYGCYLP